MKEYIFAFFAGGAITVAITYFEVSGWPILSRLAALFPVFTWLSYLFIGKQAGPEAVSNHALFVMIGTLVAWIPYMFVIYYFAPKIGSTRAIVLGLLVFILLATVFARIWISRT